MFVSDDSVDHADGMLAPNVLLLSEMICNGGVPAGPHAGRGPNSEQESHRSMTSEACVLHSGSVLFMGLLLMSNDVRLPAVIGFGRGPVRAFPLRVRDTIERAAVKVGIEPLSPLLTMVRLVRFLKLEAHEAGMGAAPVVKDAPMIVMATKLVIELQDSGRLPLRGASVMERN